MSSHHKKRRRREFVAPVQTFQPASSPFKFGGSTLAPGFLDKPKGGIAPLPPPKKRRLPPPPPSTVIPKPKVPKVVPPPPPSKQYHVPTQAEKDLETARSALIFGGVMGAGHLLSKPIEYIGTQAYNTLRSVAGFAPPSGGGPPVEPIPELVPRGAARAGAAEAGAAEAGAIEAGAARAGVAEAGAGVVAEAPLLARAPAAAAPQTWWQTIKEWTGFGNETNATVGEDLAEIEAGIAEGGIVEAVEGIAMAL